MNKDITQFLKDYKELFQDKLENLDWAEIYNLASTRFKPNNVSKFTEFWLNRGVHPEKFLDNLPSGFLADSKIDEFIIPSNIRKIGSFAFSHCRKLRDIEIPSSVNLIGWDAFAGSALERINIPNTAKLGDSGIFLDCSNLSEVTLEDGIAEIPARTFDGCKKLMQVIIPKSVKQIGYQAFANCGKNLTIKFAGTTKEWRSLSKGVFSRTFYVVQCIDGILTK